MRRLLIFVKEPVAGQVKTRLAAEIGAEAAAHVYRRCVERMLERISALQAETVLCVEPAEAIGRIRKWLSPVRPAAPQCGATLGERLFDAAQRAFTEGACRVVMIGTDSPWIDDALIEKAFLSLGQADLVLGPAKDGGYYLVGLSQPAPDLFDGISWSTGRVLDQTLAKARALGLTVSLLPEGYDIDRLTDLQQWMREDSHHGLTLGDKTHA